MEGCPIQKVKCKYTLCSDEILRNQLESHESSCPKKMIVCKYCETFEAVLLEVVEHWDTCGDVPVNCPSDGCEAKVKRANVKNHVEQDCPHTIISCEFTYAGCKARLPRHALAEHKTTAAEDHVELLASHCAAQNEQLENLESDLWHYKCSRAAFDEIHSQSVELDEDLASHCAAQSKRLENLESDWQHLNHSHATLNMNLNNEMWN